MTEIIRLAFALIPAALRVAPVRLIADFRHAGYITLLERRLAQVFWLNEMNNQEMLGKYKIIGELGRGAMGVVYEAFDTVIERTVAIKTILKSAIHGSDAEEVFNRFRREARAAGRLSHPKIISIYEYGENDDMAYIVMELVRGKELSEYFDHGRSISISEGLLIVMQLLDALDYLHTHGIVHRDIKPANILITADSKIKIADFGIAKIDSSAHTQVGVVLGTPTYMAPEQFMGHEVDRRADLYAAGVILYLFLTGERPFVGSVIAIMHQAVHRDATPPSEINPDVSKQLDAVVKKAMAKRPEDRFQSAAKFMKALKAAALTLPSAGQSPGAASMQEAHGAFAPDETLELPSRANSTGSWREADIEAWQNISHSHNPADFVQYLQNYPDGGFVELARLRIQTLEKESARIAEEDDRIRQEALARAALEEQAAQRAALEKAQADKAKALAEAQAKAKAEAEARAQVEARAKAQAEAKARLQREAETKALLARKIAMIKSEAEETRAQEEIRREKEAQEQAQRARLLSASIAERTNKIAAVVSEREAASNAERSIRMETRRKLEEEALRKKQARMQLLSIREAAENRAVAEAEEKRKREAEELAAREQEIAEAKAQAERAERLRREVEAQALREKKRNRNLMLVVGVFLVLMFVAIVFGLLPSSR